jgi:hypothetical protein
MRVIKLPRMMRICSDSTLKIVVGGHVGHPSAARSTGRNGGGKDHSTASSHIARPPNNRARIAMTAAIRRFNSFPMLLFHRGSENGKSRAGHSDSNWSLPAQENIFRTTPWPQGRNPGPLAAVKAFYRPKKICGEDPWRSRVQNSSRLFAPYPP